MPAPWPHSSYVAAAFPGPGAVGSRQPIADDIEALYSYEDDAVDDRWGWPELFIALQLLWGLALFIPGAQAYRTIIRAAPYVMSGAALVYYFRGGREQSLPASTTWLIVSFGLLLLNLLHETAHWVAGSAQIVFQICISAPVFWMAKAVRTNRHMHRVLWVFFIASAIGAIVGVLQVYFPKQFLPPEFSLFAQSLNPNLVQSLTYVGANGREIVRPPGLSDLPGGAAVSGMMAMILGLSLGLGRNVKWYTRVACFAAAVVGMTALYFTHVRSLTLVAAGAVALFAILRMRQGRTVEGTITLAAGAALVVGAYLWATAVGGDAVSDRFSSLADQGVFRMFQEQRGLVIRDTLSELLYQFPIGAGLGRWGMMQIYFGDPTMWQAPAIHVEVQVTGWLLDGGIPLVLLYAGALFVALRYTYAHAVVSVDRTWQDSGVIVLCMQLILIALCLTGPVFNTQMGIMFWAVTGALFGATLRRDHDPSHEDHEATHA
jgi:hypothetical protein